MTNLVWITPNTEELIVHMARVSNPKGQQEAKDPQRLLRYLLTHKHWSPFEMASMCLEINTTRDISAQILRHRSFSFQEFSQRYAEVQDLDPSFELRLQDTTNRQNSLPDAGGELETYRSYIRQIYGDCLATYDLLVGAGCAKEIARKVLPMGVGTRLYMSGTIRSWIHYCQVRMGPETQKEHRDVALGAWKILSEHCPNICKALNS